MPFFYIHISQGSVATCLKRGGVFKPEFVANLLRSPLVKKFENQIIVNEVMAKSLVSWFFFDSQCSYMHFVFSLALINWYSVKMTVMKLYDFQKIVAQI